MSLSLNELPLERLSDRARWALRITEMLDDEFVTPPRYDEAEYEQALKLLQLEIRELAGDAGVPDLTEDEYEALKASIDEFGQLQPILDDRDGELVDGRARLRACHELELEPDRRRLPFTLTADQRRCLALALNLARRHVGASARRGVVENELRRDPSRSDRGIASIAGVSPTTVGAVRAQLEDAGEVSRLDTRVDRRGVERPAGPSTAPYGRLVPDEYDTPEQAAAIRAKTGSVAEASSEPLLAGIGDAILETTRTGKARVPTRAEEGTIRLAVSVPDHLVGEAWHDVHAIRLTRQPTGGYLLETR